MRPPSLRPETALYFPPDVGGDEWVDYRAENSRSGIAVLLVGIAFAVGPWMFLSELGRVPAKFAAIAITLGWPFIVLGGATVIAPPRTPLNSEANKPRNGKLLLGGLAISALEAYVFLERTGGL